jgi:Protein of unknown function (DUF3455)
MTRLIRLCRAVGVGLAVATATLTMTQAANADPAPPTLAPPSLPGDTQTIAVPSGYQVFLVGHAKGVQIYTCDGNGSWGKSTSRADLVDDAGKLIVQHSKTTGPTWTATADKSAVVGTPDKNAASPAAGPAIDWLRLSTQPLAGAPTGLLTATKFIQRVNTQGGTPPPTAECKTQTAGKVKEVPYKADYYFWKAAA